MSRTYRRAFLQLDCNCGAPIEGPLTVGKNGELHWNNIAVELQRSKSRGVPPQRTCQCGMQCDYYSKRNLKRDYKCWGKAPKWYKVMKARERKAKERDAMRHRQYDSIPHFRMSNQRDWD
ncbi:MAG: hypothetical protein J7L15_02575 [Clostridiales bacterium]|nr:hypothetical protein [Clostridiales bacterium]